MFHNFSKINVGINITHAALFSIALHSFLANITVQPNIYLTQIIMLSSNIYINVNWIIATNGFIKKNVFKSKLALILWSVYICFWLGAVIVSMTSVGKLFVCLDCRCPESMWLFNNPGHNYSSLSSINDYPLDYDYSIKPVTAHTTAVIDRSGGQEPTNNADSGGDISDSTSK